MSSQGRDDVTGTQGDPAPLALMLNGSHSEVVRSAGGELRDMENARSKGQFQRIKIKRGILCYFMHKITFKATVFRTLSVLFDASRNREIAVLHPFYCFHRLIMCVISNSNMSVHHVLAAHTCF